MQNFFAKKYFSSFLLIILLEISSLSVWGEEFRRFG
jgi:hypothetical protein